MSIAMIIANGPNSVKIPCLTFATVVEAEAFLTDIFGPAGEWGWGGTEEGMRDHSEHFFKSYYDGCGGVYSYSVQEVQHGQPIVKFNLD